MAAAHKFASFIKTVKQEQEQSEHLKQRLQGVTTVTPGGAAAGKGARERERVCVCVCVRVCAEPRKVSLESVTNDESL